MATEEINMEEFNWDYDTEHPRIVWDSDDGMYRKFLWSRSAEIWCEVDPNSNPDDASEEERTDEDEREERQRYQDRCDDMRREEEE